LLREVKKLTHCSPEKAFSTNPHFLGALSFGDEKAVDVYNLCLNFVDNSICKRSDNRR